MELLRDSIPMVSLASSAAALYARVASAFLRPGLPRLAALLPVVALLAAAPLAFTSSAMLRGTSAFFLAWLGAFKVVLLAAGLGPLAVDGLPVLSFLFTALLPVKLRRGGGCPGAAAKSVSLVSCAAKVAAIATILHLYESKIQLLHRYIRLAMYGIHIYCFLDLLLPCIAAAGSALGMELEPPFDRPYLASSLRDFWGRRWNLMVSAILRPSVYDPVRARAGKAAGVVATFLISGLMHEAMVYYMTLRLPTGEMTAFFLLHGVCCVAEEWCARRWVARRWPPPPRPLGSLLVMAVAAGSSFWLFFPPICREGSEEMLLEEWAAVAAFFQDAGRKLRRAPAQGPAFTKSIKGSQTAGDSSLQTKGTQSEKKARN
ncbi:probable long-chain-alcohol O-fatty-acyltransferase 4 [Oryza glaberrima]|uniref:probable long-chain-alcohol O-fatty-acyltransferase 4 n=1 Tax=Oryza glaberrima TaxID=4538 RepID=UPI00224C2F71|nr:probable long-chain-alcohol O-fatty-acyltransferase 4 [Oryza glaberrima]